MNAPPLTVRAIRAVAVAVPLRFVLGTSAAAVRAAPLLLVDVETEEGITGRTYLFCYVRAAAPAIVSLLGAVEAAVKGQRVVPAELWAQLAETISVDRCAGRSAHGDVRLRHRLLGRARDRG